MYTSSVQKRNKHFKISKLLWGIEECSQNPLENSDRRKNYARSDQIVTKYCCEHMQLTNHLPQIKELSHKGKTFSFISSLSAGGRTHNEL
jgi:hypothetical protein